MRPYRCLRAFNPIHPSSGPFKPLRRSFERNPGFFPSLLQVSTKLPLRNTRSSACQRCRSLLSQFPRWTVSLDTHDALLPGRCKYRNEKSRSDPLRCRATQVMLEPAHRKHQDHIHQQLPSRGTGHKPDAKDIYGCGPCWSRRTFHWPTRRWVHHPAIGLMVPKVRRPEALPTRPHRRYHQRETTVIARTKLPQRNPRIALASELNPGRPTSMSEMELEQLLSRVRAVGRARVVYTQSPGDDVIEAVLAGLRRL